MLKILISIMVFSALLSAKTTIIESNDKHIIFSYSPELTGFEEVKTADGFITYTPKVKSAYQFSEKAGLPMRFVHSELIAIPNENTYIVEVLAQPEYDEIDALMTPVRDIYSKDNLNAEYRIGSEYFSFYTDRFTYEYTGIVGNTKVVRINFDAAFFSNYHSSIIIPKEFLVKVTYNSEVSKGKNTRKLSSNLNVLNKSVADNWISDTPNKNVNQFLNNEKIYSDGNWYKLKIDRDGVYRITASQLSNNGITIPAAKVNTIKIIGNGGYPLSELPSDGQQNQFNEQEIIVNKDNNGNLSEIIFFASDTKGFEYVNGHFERYLNWYSNDNFYLLTWGGDEGLRAKESEIVGNVENRPTTYYHRIFAEEDIFNPYPSGGGRQFLGKEFNNLVLTNVLHNLDRTQKVYYKVAVAHTSSNTATVEVMENNNKFSSPIYLRESSGYYVGDRQWKSYSIDGNKIASDNRSKIDLIYNGNNISSAFLDYYEIHYPREFLALSNELEFWSNPEMSGITEYNIRNFSSSKKYAYDITDIHNPKLIKNLASDLDKIIFKSVLEENEPRRFYLTSELRNVANLEKVEIKNHRTTKHNKDIILITDEALISSANEYKKYREANSEYTVGVYTTQELFNEFAAGVPDIVAIRDFIANAFVSWDVQPQYVILWGDGHTDHRKISHKASNFVPPFLSIDTLNLDETKSTSFDDFYVRVNGDDTQIDLSIGRVTINNNQEGLNFINKLDHYENKSATDNWRKRVTLVADDSQTSDRPDGDMHTVASEDLANLDAMQKFLVNKIYLPEFETVYTANGRRKPDANAQIIKAMRDEGSVVINWTGHGNPTVWSHESVFTQNNSIKELNNLNKLTFFCAATCEFGRFDQVTGITAAEELLQSPNGGAIGVFAATRLVYASSNAALNEIFFDVLLSKAPETNDYRSLGNVLFDVKQIRKASNDEKYLLLGDPTMKLLFPNNNVVFDEINNIRLDNNNDMIDLEGLSEINVKGRITNTSNELMSGFNGNVLFSIFDGDESVQINEGTTIYNFTKYGGILNKSSFKVENGLFEANFILPKDISYSNNNGRMFAYAINNENTSTAKGHYDRFFVSGLGNSDKDDNKGPEIRIFVDSRDFENGDIVSQQPNLIVELEDPLGINSTGIGIGHRIEAWLNDDPKSIDLSNNYTTSIENSRIGSSEAILKNAKPGLNKITVRAWDIFNNFSIETAYFYIKGDGNDLWLGDIKNYPNPFEFETAIKFRHNLDIPFDANINIYDIDGKLVRSISETLFNKYADEVKWNGKDEDGVFINSGSYYIQVNLTDKNNQKITKSGILSLKVK